MRWKLPWSRWLEECGHIDPPRPLSSFRYYQTYYPSGLSFQGGHGGTVVHWFSSFLDRSQKVVIEEFYSAPVYRVPSCPHVVQYVCETTRKVGTLSYQYANDTHLGFSFHSRETVETLNWCLKEVRDDSKWTETKSLQGRSAISGPECHNRFMEHLCYAVPPGCKVLSLSYCCIQHCSECLCSSKYNNRIALADATTTLISVMKASIQGYPYPVTSILDYCNMLYTPVKIVQIRTLIEFWWVHYKWTHIFTGCLLDRFWAQLKVMGLILQFLYELEQEKKLFWNTSYFNMKLLSCYLLPTMTGQFTYKLPYFEQFSKNSNSKLLKSFCKPCPFEFPKLNATLNWHWVR